MNKKNFILVGILLVLVVIFLFTKLNNRSEKLFRFFEIDSTAVESFEFSTTTDTLRLEKIAEKWMIGYPVKFEPKENKIKDIFAKLIKVETSKTPIAENEESQVTYNVADSLGVRVKIFGKEGKVIAEALVSKSKANYSYSYARKVNEKDIYQLLTNVYNIVEPNLNNWRNNQIAQISKENIASINVAYSKSSYSLAFKDSVWTHIGTDEEFTVSPTNKTLMKILNGLENMRTSQFIDDDFESWSTYFENPILSIQVILLSGETIKFVIANDKDQDMFALMKDDAKECLYVMTANWIDRFTLSANHFKEEVETEKQ